MESAWIGFLGVILGAVVTSGATIFMKYLEDKRKRKEKELDEYDAMRKDEMSIYNDVIKAYGEHSLIIEAHPPFNFNFDVANYQKHIRSKFFKNIYLNQFHNSNPLL
ncbi:hypothetical protein [Paenibacillus sp. An7]|uniref:hypothetical protein n=1 Tax=Paenibacillus sp. An7 TaxID=2689577 RepID=UPI0013589B80|nr:hypothetical protein [Paenibacillus sp. An7]